MRNLTRNSKKQTNGCKVVRSLEHPQKTKVVPRKQRLGFWPEEPGIRQISLTSLDLQMESNSCLRHKCRVLSLFYIFYPFQADLSNYNGRKQSLLPSINICLPKTQEALQCKHITLRSKKYKHFSDSRFKYGMTTIVRRERGSTALQFIQERQQAIDSSKFYNSSILKPMTTILTVKTPRLRQT